MNFFFILGSKQEEFQESYLKKFINLPKNTKFLNIFSKNPSKEYNNLSSNNIELLIIKDDEESHIVNENKEHIIPEDKRNINSASLVRFPSKFKDNKNCFSAGTQNNQRKFSENITQSHQYDDILVKYKSLQESYDKLKQDNISLIEKIKKAETLMLELNEELKNKNNELLEIKHNFNNLVKSTQQINNNLQSIKLYEVEQ